MKPFQLAAASSEPAPCGGALILHDAHRAEHAVQDALVDAHAAMIRPGQLSVRSRAALASSTCVATQKPGRAKGMDQMRAHLTMAPRPLMMVIAAAVALLAAACGDGSGGNGPGY